MKKFIYYIVSLLILLSLTGCGAVLTNYHEVSSLQIVQTLGIDNSEDGVVISISTGSTDEADPTIISHPGATITTAMDLLQEYSTKENLFFAHTSHIALGQQTAEEGIAYILDYVTRAIQMRTVIPIYVVKGGTAKELVTGTGDGTYDITDVLQSFERNIELRSENHVYTTGEIARSLVENGAALMSAVHCEKTDDVIFSGGGGLAAIPDGFAVIKEDRLIGFLSPDMARSVNLLLGRIRGGYTIVEASEGDRVTLDFKSGETKFKAIYADDGSIEKITVDTRLETGVSEMKVPSALTNKEYLSSLEKMKQSQTAELLKQVLEYSRDQRADFLGLGKILRSQDPVSFSKIPGGWEDALGSAVFEITVKVDILMSYDIINPTVEHR